MKTMTGDQRERTFAEDPSGILKTVELPFDTAPREMSADDDPGDVPIDAAVGRGAIPSSDREAWKRQYARDPRRSAMSSPGCQATRGAPSGRTSRTTGCVSSATSSIATWASSRRRASSTTPLSLGRRAALQATRRTDEARDGAWTVMDVGVLVAVLGALANDDPSVVRGRTVRGRRRPADARASGRGRQRPAVVRQGRRVAHRSRIQLYLPARGVARARPQQMGRGRVERGRDPYPAR